MRKALMSIVVASLSVFLFAGCAKNNPVAPSQAFSQGGMRFALDASDSIASGKVTISKGALTLSQPITITNHIGTVTINGLQVGNWNIQVQLFDADGVEIYTGNGTALVNKNQTTNLAIHVNQNTGNLTISVDLTNNILLEDFESLTVGQSLRGQGIWNVPTQGSGLPIVVQEGSNKVVRAGSASDQQPVMSTYTAPFTADMTYTYFQYSAKITSGAWSSSDLWMGTGSWMLGPSLEFNIQTGNIELAFLSDVELSWDQRWHVGLTNLQANTWYDIRAIINWQSSTASVQYKLSSQQDWISVPALTNIPITPFNTPGHDRGLFLRVNGKDGSYGEMDNIYIGY